MRHGVATDLDQRIIAQLFEHLPGDRVLPVHRVYIDAVEFAKFRVATGGLRTVPAIRNTIERRTLGFRRRNVDCAILEDHTVVVEQRILKPGRP
jgi:hypothetical protein